MDGLHSFMCYSSPCLSGLIVYSELTVVWKVMSCFLRHHDPRQHWSVSEVVVFIFVLGAVKQLRERGLMLILEVISVLCACVAGGLRLSQCSCSWSVQLVRELVAYVARLAECRFATSAFSVFIIEAWISFLTSLCNWWNCGSYAPL